MESLAISPIAPFRTTITPPGSKSLTNRALLLAALADGESTLTGVLFADDSRRMLAALQALQFDVTIDEPNATVTVVGRGGTIPSTGATLNLGNAGTAYRFLTAVMPLGRGEYVLDGIERMRQRPVKQLVDALRQIGATIRYTMNDGCPPLHISAKGSLAGGELTMPPTLSSQYISALLQIGGYCEKGLTIDFDGPVTSRPYVEMTLRLMQTFGVTAQVDPQFTRITVPAGARYRATNYRVEPDASNASYFLAAAAVLPGSSCTIEGLGKRSLQGDVGFADLLHQMGAGLLFGGDFITVMAARDGRLRGIDVNLNHMPDMAQTLAVVALFAEGTTTIRDVGNLRVKETDRLAALKNELTKLGALVEIEGDDISIAPPPNGKLTPAAIDTYDDHRMAMSFAIAGLRSPGVVINDPKCVNKTFPEYFDYLRRLEHARV